MKTVKILGYDVSTQGLERDVQWAQEVAAFKEGAHYVACANPHSLVVAEKDDVFRSALKQADILLPDGVGIVLAAKLLGLQLSERVAGSEFFAEFSRQAEEKGEIRYFFLGSTEEVLQRIRGRLAREFPSIEVCGTFSPLFTSEFSEAESSMMCDQINAARPDVLWVGLTAPKQEKWIYQNKQRLNVPLIGAIGAVFDFYAGTKKRAPEWVCKLGLEWLPRLLREPRRLFRRNFVSTPLFLLMVFREKFRKQAGRL